MILVELVSYMGAITSFKADALANECFIETVKTRSNLRKLLSLVGISLKGPGSSSARGKLTWAATDDPTDAQVSSITINNTNRVVTVPSPQDGSPVAFVLYKLDSNNNIENIQLSVDIDNYKALNLYLKHKFKIANITNSKYYIIANITKS